MPVDRDSYFENNVHFVVDEKLTSKVKTKSDSSKYRVNNQLLISRQNLEQAPGSQCYYIHEYLVIDLSAWWWCVNQWIERESYISPAVTALVAVSSASHNCSSTTSYFKQISYIQVIYQNIERYSSAIYRNILQYITTVQCIRVYTLYSTSESLERTGRESVLSGGKREIGSNLKLSS